MRDLTHLLREQVVLPLNELGIPIDLRGVQALLLAVPILIGIGAFVIAGFKKRQRMKDAGM
jgi:hypothetical protein